MVQNIRPEQMKLGHKIPFEKVNFLPKITTDYIGGVGSYFDQSEGCSDDLSTLSVPNFSLSRRNKLVDVLVRQYESCSMEIPRGAGLLRDANTFTVTTGHQLCLFGGPVYILYKIASTIAFTRKLNEAHSDKKFVPLFWLASEDHDFDEVSTLNVGKTSYKWNNEEKGCIGRMTTIELKGVLSELKSSMSYLDNDLLEEVEKSMVYDTVSKQYRSFIHGLFGSEELVIVDPDDRDLKKEFLPIVRAEFDGLSKRYVEQNNKKLTDAGYKLQAFIRDINLFYVDKGIRERIILDQDSVKWKSSKQNFSKAEFMEMIEEFPERISPNVILRPIYQQLILPNAVYIGGGSEIAYWLQLEDLFSELQIFKPQLSVRSSFLFVQEKLMNQWTEMGYDYQDLFESPDQLKNELVIRNASTDISHEINAIGEAFDAIQNKVASHHSELNSMIGAERRKLQKQLEFLEKRILKADKSKNKVSLQRVDKIIGKVKPEGKWQERYSSVFDFFTDKESINELIDFADPSANSVNIMLF